MHEFSPEQRARDLRLAWILVGAGAVVTLTLVVLIGGVALRYAGRAIERDMARGRADRPVVLTPTVPPPPDTAHPIGSPAKWIGPDDYPPGALRDGDEGRVRVTVAVGPDGRATGCSVAQSSGSWSLDNGTCTVMMNNGRFDRAQPGEAGIRRWTSPPVRWVLPRE